MEKTLTITCPHCGKVIESLYEKQLEFNFNSHLLACKKNKTVEKQNETST